MYLGLKTNILVCTAAAHKVLRYHQFPTCYCSLQTQLLNLFPPWIDAPCVWWNKPTHPSCASTFSSTGTPPHKPPSAGFPASRSLCSLLYLPKEGDGLAGTKILQSLCQGGLQERDIGRKGFCLPCLYVILCFPDRSVPSPLHAVPCRQHSGGSSALLHIPAPALKLVTGCCSEDTFCALPPLTHIIWIHIIKRLAAEIAHRKIILNWFINAHLCRILKYDKNMRVKEKESEWE